MMASTSNSPNDDLELSEIFDSARICGGAEHTLLILLYSPVGVILSVIRLFMLLNVYIISCILPLNLPIFRMMVRLILMLCGLTVRVRNEEHRRDACPIIVSNYISPVDRLILSLVQPNIMANEWGLPPFLSWLFGLKDLNAQNSRETFLQNARLLCQDTRVPLYTRPEGCPTSGKHALLKFSTWQFSIADSVQPIVLTACRPMPIAMTTMRSNALSDIFWVIFTPYTLFTVSYLPVMKKADKETPEAFSEVVRGRMADVLNIKCSKYSRHDSREFVKRLLHSRQLACDTTAASSRVKSHPLAPNLEAMVQYCKEVVPQVPLDILRAEILRTEDSEATLSNIFEGNIQYEAEDETQVPSQARSTQVPSQARSTHAEPLPMQADTGGSRSGASQTYAAKVFAKQSNQREMSLGERKNAMLTEARIRYIDKHGLSITLEEIESGRH